MVCGGSTCPVPYLTCPVMSLIDPEPMNFEFFTVLGSKFVQNHFFDTANLLNWETLGQNLFSGVFCLLKLSTYYLYSR